MFYAYNKLSSLGSFVTVLRVMIFTLILWEAFVSQRSLIFVAHSSVHLEWVSSRLPVSYHTNNESLKPSY
jgi:hypothetical protein